MKKATVLGVVAAMALTMVPAAAMAAPATQEAVVAPEASNVGVTFAGNLAPGVTAYSSSWMVNNGLTAVYLTWDFGQYQGSWYVYNSETGAKFYPDSRNVRAEIPAGNWGSYRVVLTNNTSTVNYYRYEVNIY